MDNYIVINGKKAELTQEQLEKLGIVVEKKDPFKRVEYGQRYHWISGDGNVYVAEDDRGVSSELCFVGGNYCTDKELIEQRALHETLNRLLWRYAMQHNDGSNTLGWNNWCIYHNKGKFYVMQVNRYTTDMLGVVYFENATTAEAAIEEIVKPFMAEHPEFRW